MDLELSKSGYGVEAPFPLSMDQNMERLTPKYELELLQIRVMISLPRAMPQAMPRTDARRAPPLG